MNDNIEQCYKDLATAIVLKAATDYHQAAFFLDTYDQREYKSEDLKRWNKAQAERTLIEVEDFFKSDWFTELCPDIDGTKAFEALKETYKNEQYYSLMERYLKLSNARNSNNFYNDYSE